MAERKIIASTTAFTMKDLLNSRNGIALKDCVGTINITAAALVKVTDPDAAKEEDREKTVATLVAEDGTVMTSISESVGDTVFDLCAYESDFFEDGVCQVRVISRKSKSDREFLSLLIL